MPQSSLTFAHPHIPRRPRSRQAALLFLGVLLLSAILCGAMVRIAARGVVVVYSVATLHHHLDHDRAAWIGQTVWVRGDVQERQGRPYADRRADSQMYLVDPAAPSSLLFFLGPPDALNSAIRRVPLLGALWPPPQVPRLDVLTEYRVRLGVVPCLGDRLCDACVLLDTQFPHGAVSVGYRAKDANEWM